VLLLVDEEDWDSNVLGTTSDGVGDDGIDGRLTVLEDHDWLICVGDGNELADGLIVHSLLGGSEGDNDFTLSAVDGNAGLLFLFEVHNNAKE